jgi:hypothetical protein
MQILCQLALLMGIASLSVLSQAQVQRYEKEKVRQILLDLGQNLPRAEFTVQGEVKDQRVQLFLSFYENVIEPRKFGISKVEMRYRTYNILIDSGSYNDDSEYSMFKDELVNAALADNEYSVDPQVTAELNEFARLAEGLTGDLADLARRWAHERDLESFPPELKPKLDEIETLEQDYEQTLKDVPSASKLREFTTALTELRRKFKNSEITLEEAMKAGDELYRTGGTHFIGKEAIDAKGNNLNRIAVLRSELAKAKGFPSWAAYRLEMNGQGYEANYRGPANQRAFLRHYIEALAKVQAFVLDERIKALGLEGIRDQLRDEHVGFLTLPSLLQIQNHFPIDQITNMWEKTMVESGFTNEALGQILVDDEFREGKNRTMAYMAGLIGPHTEQVTVDAGTLNWVQTPRDSQAWIPGFSYILQSYKTPGVSSLETAFHEGGHALEKALKFKQVAADESYGYVEVPSLTMESFMVDPEVLWNLAVEVDGAKPSLQEVSLLVDNQIKNEIMNTIFQAGQALFDLELWDYDYSAQGAKTFLERVQQLDAEIAAMKGDLPELEKPVAGWYGSVSTTHYTSGTVRYIGYVYADIGSRMMTEFISDEIEKLSGRRSWYRQPQLASIFADRFFAEGWKTLFPGNIERITGRKFDPDAVVEKMAKRVGMP